MIPRSAARAQTSSVLKKSRGRSLAFFGLRRPSTGPGTFKKRPGMKNRSWGKGPDFWGPTSQQNVGGGQLIVLGLQGGVVVQEELIASVLTARGSAFDEPKRSA